jgi:hypothetical protein
MKIGLLQIGGPGDILIALPSARHSFERGHEVHWRLPNTFLPPFKETVPWVNCPPLGRDPNGDPFDQTPIRCSHRQLVRSPVMMGQWDCL